jgi:hypothetical protein
MRGWYEAGWPDANNDEEAPVPGRDWVFVLVVLWAIIATLANFLH